MNPYRDAPLLQGVQKGELGLTSVGRYGLRRVLGTGPSGTVYVGYDPEDGRDVAVNLMAALEPGPGDVVRACVADEARAWAQVQHPSLVQVHDVGVYRDPRTGHTGVYVVRELVVGLDLQRWLDARPRFSGTKSWLGVLEMFVPIARVLATAHAAGLVHRRFCPASVVVDYDNRVKLLDFGTFHAAPVRPAESEVEYFEPPELACGAPADARSDQYSFCAALWAATYRATGGKVPSALARVLARGMRSDPRNRWADMAELVQRLDRCRPWWSRPATAALTAAAAGTALAMGIGAAVF
jgi:eukaryotic-like serine/threonine-protein kinase